MSHFSRLSRIVCGSCLTLLLGGACGGRSTQNDGNEAGSEQGGSSSTAGTHSSGSVGIGGKVGTAGTAGAGGTGNVGGSGTAGTGVAGTGTSGYAGEGCTAPPVGGECDAYIPAWYHDPNTGICRPFVYGGCGGNDNRYATLAECQKACRDGSPNYDACTVASDCVITGNGCCGVCDGPELTAHDVIAYNPKYQQQLLCNFVRGASAPARDVPACAPCPPATGGVMRYFIPECVSGQCGVIDLRQTSLLTCQSDDDCTLRSGTSCCPSCSGDDPIAIRKDADLQKLVCDGAPVPCPACLPNTGFARAVCASGKCAVDEQAQTL